MRLGSKIFIRSRGFVASKSLHTHLLVALPSIQMDVCFSSYFSEISEIKSGLTHVTAKFLKFLKPVRLSCAGFTILGNNLTLPKAFKIIRP